MVSGSDIVILGGGLNGAALACALARGPHSVAVIEPHPPGPAGAAWDSRIYAYSPGNVDWIKSLGGWDEHVRAQAVYRMRVRGDDGGSLTFDALDAGLSDLAWIAENNRLQASLWRAFQDSANVKAVAARAEAVTWGADGHHVIHLADGGRIATRLLVAADGANSWLRQQAGIGILSEDYRHVGVVANFEIGKPHRGTAYQWFRPDGVLAWLPLPDRHMSMVWSTPPAHAAELLALPPESLSDRVAAAGGHILGALRCATPAAGFPLIRRRAETWVKPGLVLLGDAAHTVHPLAGQGVNLGFRDSRLLAGTLSSGGDPGEIGRLTAYAARRMEDVASMQFTTGGLKKLFARNDSLTRQARNLGMTLADRFDPVNQALTRHAVL